MPEEPVKRRLKKARNSALSELINEGCDVILSDGGIFHLVAVKRRRVLFIRLATDKAKEWERKIVRSFATSSKTISREIWLRKFRKKRFEIIKIK